jgi:hypothetical protein
MKRIATDDHRLLSKWAADCAEHVLFLFEDYYPDDDRPRKAIECSKYGPPEGLKPEEIPKPVLRDDEVHVEVHASSVNSNMNLNCPAAKTDSIHF